MIVTVTDKLKKRFVKDYSFPINIFTEPYYSYFLELYEPLLHTQNKWELYINETGRFNTDQEYFAYYNDVKDQVINFIKSQPSFKKFNTGSTNQFKVDTMNINTKGVFKDCNKNKELVSIDLKKGNFNALKFFNAELVDNCNSYEEFIGKFTNDQHIIESKYIRQVIFGACNPGRQIAIEKYMMSYFLTNLLDIVPIKNFIAYMNDELVIDLKDINKDLLYAVISQISRQHHLEVNVETFTLKKFKGTDYFVKVFDHGFELKCVPALFYNLIYKSYMNIPVEDNDLYFYNEGFLSKFVDVPAFIIE